MLVVNGRFLRARPTGLHRVGRALLDASRAAGLEDGLEMQVIAPRGVDDPRVDRHVWAPPGRAGDHSFEQFILPALARKRRVLSLTNTAPVYARHGIVAVHDLAMVSHPEWYARSMRAYARLVVAAARRADLVLTFSQTVAGELEQAGVTAKRIRLIREAVNPAFAPAPPEAVAAVRERLGTREPYVLMVGWAQPRKDLATAIAAHRKVLPEIPHRLVLVGESHDTFASVPVPDDPSIVRAGHLSDTELVAALTGASALLYPSLYEGFGLPPLEAWACGTPAIVSDIPVLRESTGGRGEFVAVGDAEAWAGALRRALLATLEVPAPPAWQWADAGRQLLAALA
jgi:glycosyltransferase involved in cell wall biosynthesis